jgi:hypothetical protein
LLHPLFQKLFCVAAWLLPLLLLLLVRLVLLLVPLLVRVKEGLLV